MRILRVMSVPTSVTIPAGQSHVAFPITLQAVTAQTDVTLSAGTRGTVGVGTQTRLTITP